jgi:hypothetical protein
MEKMMEDKVRKIKEEAERKAYEKLNLQKKAISMIDLVIKGSKKEGDVITESDKNAKIEDREEGRSRGK